MITSANVSAAQGMQQALQSYNRAAAQVANPDKRVEAKDLVGLKTSEHQFKANAKAFAVSNQMTEHLIDIIA
ncbi:MAG: hypothetical protein KDB00_05385 [Planctomycetales bacterium]|nr:hypothetical protein [Planctomycetales bacterium]